jgi:hypothetical protein
MPSYNLDLRDPQTALRILVCLIEQAKGELQLWAQDYDSLDKGKLLTVDYNRKKGIISLRVTSDNGGAVTVQPEAHAWTQPPQVAPLERARSEAAQKSQRTHVPSDEELAAMEENQKRIQELANLEREGKAPLRINIKQ